MESLSSEKQILYHSVIQQCLNQNFLKIFFLIKWNKNYRSIYIYMTNIQIEKYYIAERMKYDSV